MSAAPQPDITGNVTVVAPCVNCSGDGSTNSPSQAQEYGGPFQPMGALPMGATVSIAQGEKEALSVTPSDRI